MLVAVDGSGSLDEVGTSDPCMWLSKVAAHVRSVEGDGDVVSPC